VPFPDKETRKEILRIHTRRKPLDNTIDIDKLVELTNGCTGADMAAIVNAAAMSAIKEHIADISIDGSKDKKSLNISMRHFEAAVQKIKKKSAASTAISNSSLV
jgi:transitional endoplasmic reticulum ATPase